VGDVGRREGSSPTRRGAPTRDSWCGGSSLNPSAPSRLSPFAGRSSRAKRSDEENNDEAAHQAEEEVLLRAGAGGAVLREGVPARVGLPRLKHPRTRAPRPFLTLRTSFASSSSRHTFASKRRASERRTLPSRLRGARPPRRAFPSPRRSREKARQHPHGDEARRDSRHDERGTRAVILGRSRDESRDRSGRFIRSLGSSPAAFRGPGAHGADGLAGGLPRGPPAPLLFAGAA